MGRNIALCALVCAAVSLGTTQAIASETITYRYDALGRLVAMSNTGAVNDGLATSVAYDPAGNRLSYGVTGAGGTGGGGTVLVTDASFENPPQNGGYTYGPVVTGASFSGYAGVAGNGSGWGFAAAPDGNQVAFIQGYASANGVISLAVSGLTPGATYAVRFAVAQRPGFVANPLTVGFAPTSQGTASLGTFTPASTSFAYVTSASFTASAATGTLTFTGTSSSGDLSTGLDAISIVAGAAGPTVPDSSFESPPLGGSGYVETPSVTGVTFTGWSGITSNSSDWGYSPAPDGVQAAFLSGQNWALPTMSLAVTGLTPGATYHVSFMMARRPYYTPPTVHVTIGSTVLGDYTPVASTNAFTAFSTPAFTATSSSATLTFAVTTLGDTAIDKVSVAP